MSFIRSFTHSLIHPFIHSLTYSGDIDLCLVPEIPLTDELLRGPEGYLPFLFERVREHGHAVVVVAEGAGEELCGKSAEVDKGGNRKLPKIGVRVVFFLVVALSALKSDN